MADIIEKSDWKEFLQNFSRRHRGERTRLGVFEIRDGVVNDLWIEDGIPLVGIDVDTKEGRQSVDLVFEHYSHSIENVATILPIDDQEGGLDIRDDEGKTTALRFEDYPVERED